MSQLITFQIFIDIVFDYLADDEFSLVVEIQLALPVSFGCRDNFIILRDFRLKSARLGDNAVQLYREHGLPANIDGFCHFITVFYFFPIQRLSFVGVLILVSTAGDRSSCCTSSSCFAS